LILVTQIFGSCSYIVWFSLLLVSLNTVVSSWMLLFLDFSLYICENLKD